MFPFLSEIFTLHESAIRRGDRNIQARVKVMPFFSSRKAGSALALERELRALEVENGVGRRVQILFASRCYRVRIWPVVNPC